MSASTRIRAYIQDIIAFSPRQGAGEVATANYLKKKLKSAGVPYMDQVVETTVPITTRAELYVDGKPIECRGTGLESGVIEGKDYIVSNLMYGNDDFYFPSNINFNPRSEEGISMALYYKHASIAINKHDLQKLLQAKKIRGEVKVKPYTFDSHNIIVGNRTNPKTIVFCHYDCWETGAIDNASGTALMLDVALEQPEILNNHLFVFAGNEEVSYDEPVFWGKGYRQFQDTYDSLLQGSERIIVVDGIGYSPTEITSHDRIVYFAFPLRNFDRFADKTELLAGSFEYLMDYYHCTSDDMRHFKNKYIEESRALLLKRLDTSS